MRVLLPLAEEAVPIARTFNPVSRRQFIAAVFLLLGGLVTSCDAVVSSSTDANGPSKSDAPNAFVAAADLIVGVNRFPFVLFESDRQAILGADVNVAFAKLTDKGSSRVTEPVEAIFYSVTGEFSHEHQDGMLHGHEDVAGVYVIAGAYFEEPGLWEAEFVVRRPESSETFRVTAAFEVREESLTFSVGDEVPASLNPTVWDVDELREITSDPVPIRGLYELTVAEALSQSKPVIVAFATPAFCISRACGPVTQLVAALYERYREHVNFIHIEPWMLKIARDEGKLVPTEVATEWRLPSEPWVFVIDSHGRVAARFEGMVSTDELVQAIQKVEH